MHGCVQLVQTQWTFAERLLRCQERASGSFDCVNTRVLKVFEQCYTDFAPDQLEIGVSELILKDLETFIKQFPAA